MRKLFLIIGTFLMILAGSSFLAVQNPTPAYAACDSEGVKLFSLPAWYRGLVDEKCEIVKISNQGDGIRIEQFVWTVIGNIFDAIFRIAGVLAVGYIIWGGFQYMTSTGNESRMAGAKKTITNAVVGLVISIAASGIVQLVMGVF